MPGQDDLTLEVIEVIEQLLFKEPSRLEMAKGLIEKFAIYGISIQLGRLRTRRNCEGVCELHRIHVFGRKHYPKRNLTVLIQQIDNESDLQ